MPISESFDASKDMPPPEETAHFLAHLHLARVALKESVAMALPEKMMDHFEREVGQITTPSSRFSRLPRYEPYLLRALSMELPMFPAGRYASVAQQRTNHSFANLINDISPRVVFNPRTSREMRRSLQDTREHVRKMAVVDGLRRLGVLEIGERDNYFVPRGLIGAASYLRADIDDLFDRTIHTEHASIQRHLKKYQVRPRNVIGADGRMQLFYNLLPELSEDVNGKVAIDGKKNTKYKLFWNEIKNDVNRIRKTHGTSAD